MEAEARADHRANGHQLRPNQAVPCCSNRGKNPLVGGGWWVSVGRLVNDQANFNYCLDFNSVHLCQLINSTTSVTLSDLGLSSLFSPFETVKLLGLIWTFLSSPE